MSSKAPRSGAEAYGDARTLPRLEGERVHARWMTEDDLDGLLTVWGDPEVMEFMDGPVLANQEDASAFLGKIREGFEQRSLFQWGFVLPAEDRVIGTCTLLAFDWTHGRCEIGFALAKKHWRQGLISAGAAMIIEHAFETLGLHRIEADVDPNNVGSLGLLERLGFVREGHLRERYLQNGEWQDSVMLGLLRHEWRS